MIIGINGKIGSGKDTVGKIIQYLTSKEGSKMSYSSFQLLETRWYNPDDWQIKKFAFKLKQITSLLTGIPVEDLEKQEVKDMLLGEEWVRYGYADGFTKKYIGNGEMSGTIMNHKDCSKERYEEELKINWQTAYKHHYTVRDLLQRIGTEAMRETIHPNIWVNALMSEYKPIGDNLLEGEIRKVREEDLIYPNWIITDMRFPNEAKAVKEKGIFIRINRPVDLRIPELWELYPNKELLIEPDENSFKEWLKEYDIDLFNAYNHPSEIALDSYDDFDYIIENNGTIEDLIQQVKRILEAEQII